MRPIDHKVDISLCEALSCAEYRFPDLTNLSPESGVLCLSLRYGLIGVAANAYILGTCEPSERKSLIRQLKSFGSMIADHIDQDIKLNPNHLLTAFQAKTAEQVYSRLFTRYCELLQFGCPLDLSLSILVEEFTSVHSGQVKPRFFPFGARAARRAFETQSQKSLKYALGFHERRKLDLEEVPEIALLDE